MLKRVNRLKKRYQFNYVYKQGSHFFGKTMTIFVSTSKTKNIKVGFAVSKKIGYAFKRNLIKRRLREIVYSEINNLKQNYNLIVVAKDNIENFSFDEIKNDFKKLIVKADLLNEETF